MKTKYLCPECNGTLNIDEDIILIAKKMNGKKGFIILHTNLENHDSRMDCSFKIDRGELVDFICPLCQIKLDHYKEKTKLSKIIRVDDNDQESQVIFSKIYGEKARYHVKDKKVLSYGEHAQEYNDPEWFL